METAESDRLDEILNADSSEISDEKSHKDNNAQTNSNEKPIILCAHLNGKVVPIEDVEDEAFSEKILGDGNPIEPSERKLFSPCDGKVDTVFDTKHAINIVSSDGAEILLHIGIDTVKLGGKYFESHVSEGDNIKKGDLLITFDIGKIKKAGYKTTTPMVICNSDDYTKLTVTAKGTVKAGSELMKIEK